MVTASKGGDGFKKCRQEPRCGKRWLVIGCWYCLMSNVWILVFDNFTNEVVFVLFGWVASASLIRTSVNLCLGCSVVLLYNVRMNTLTVIFTVNTKLGLSEKV